MANGKEIKRRIKSVKNTAKITKAMELISTVKMKKSQDSALEKKAFVKGLLEMFLKVSDSAFESIFFKNPSWGKTLGVVVSSNKWLCGGYNINVMKKVSSYVKENPDEQIEFVTLGKKASQFIARTGNILVADYSHDYTDNADYYFSKRVSSFLLEKFLSGEYQRVVVFYNHYINTIKQIPVSRKFLSLTKQWVQSYFKQIMGEELVMAKTLQQTIYSFEPSKEDFIKHMMPLLLDSMFFDILLEAKASEHSSRMIAMKSAKDNANKYASKLTLAYNKARQAAITKEVSEIVSGVESMRD